MHNIVIRTPQIVKSCRSLEASDKDLTQVAIVTLMLLRLNMNLININTYEELILIILTLILHRINHNPNGFRHGSNLSNKL